MLQSIMHILKQKHIVLASGSPRRKELLDIIDLQFDAFPARFKHCFDPRNFRTYAEYLETTALQKVLDVKHQLLVTGLFPHILIGAHTIVTLDGQILGKVFDVDQAYQMLTKLSGRTHTVYTGVVIKTWDKTVKFTDKTDVTFKELDDDQILTYIASGEPLDMDGGYCIKGAGAAFVERVEGDYFNAVGLPLFRLCLVLYKMYNNCT